MEYKKDDVWLERILKGLKDFDNAKDQNYKLPMKEGDIGYL
jgi:hypothetical protein